MVSPARKLGTFQIAVATGVLLVAALFAITAVTQTADAKKFKGTGKADVLNGTNKKDKMKGKGGNDTITGRGGKDVLSGGSGDDVLDAVDGARDKKIKGGSGKNICRVDLVDVPIAKGCTTLEIAGAGAGGGGGGSGDGSGDGANALTLTSSSGLTCGSALPTCVFELNGTGADSDVGTVTGKDGVTGAGGVVAIQSDGSWQAAGAYGCDGPGSLHVEIGSKSLDVPVTCTTP